MAQKKLSVPVPPGYKLLPEFENIKGLDEEAKKALMIPGDAKVINITNRFEEGGPIIISYSRPTTPEQKAENRKELQRAIDRALDAIAARCEREPEFYEALKKKYGVE